MNFKVIYNKYIVFEDDDIYSLISGKFLKPDISKDGYYSVTLCDENSEKNRIKIHRLVTLLFIPNPENKNVDKF